jgi:hypothetical protein
MSAVFAGRHVVGFGNLSIDVLLEVQISKMKIELNIISNQAFASCTRMIILVPLGH